MSELFFYYEISELTVILDGHLNYVTIDCNNTKIYSELAALFFYF